MCLRTSLIPYKDQWIFEPEVVASSNDVKKLLVNKNRRLQSFSKLSPSQEDRYLKNLYKSAFI